MTPGVEMVVDSIDWMLLWPLSGIAGLFYFNCDTSVVWMSVFLPPGAM